MIHQAGLILKDVELKELDNNRTLDSQLFYLFEGNLTFDVH